MRSFKINLKQRKTILKEITNFEKKTTDKFVYFFAKLDKITIHLYQNNTILIQGNLVKIKSFLEKYKLNKTATLNETIPYFGCDESGVGDLFGPIVITVFYLDSEVFKVIKNLNLRDSKEITNQEIEKLALKLMQYPQNFITKIISNPEFNKQFGLVMNLKELLTFYYLQTINKIVNTKKYQKIIIDGYTKIDYFKKHCTNLNLKLNYSIKLVTKAENKYLAVAAASIISRFIFLQEIKKMAETIKRPILLGANFQVKMLIKELFTKFKKEKMNQLVKLGYKGVIENIIN